MRKQCAHTHTHLKKRSDNQIYQREIITEMYYLFVCPFEYLMSRICISFSVIPLFVFFFFNIFYYFLLYSCHFFQISTSFAFSHHLTSIFCDLLLIMTNPRDLIQMVDSFSGSFTLSVSLVK